MTKLGEDIINMYKPYRNHNAKWKVTTISKQRFEIYDKYEIIDVSNPSSIQSVREHMALLWLPKTRTNSWPSKRSTRPSSTRSLQKELSDNWDFSSCWSTRILSILRQLSFPNLGNNSRMFMWYPRWWIQTWLRSSRANSLSQKNTINSSSINCFEASNIFIQPKSSTEIS